LRCPRCLSPSPSGLPIAARREPARRWRTGPFPYVVAYSGVRVNVRHSIDLHPLQRLTGLGVDMRDVQSVLRNAAQAGACTGTGSSAAGPVVRSRGHSPGRHIDVCAAFRIIDHTAIDWAKQQRPPARQRQQPRLHPHGQAVRLVRSGEGVGGRLSWHRRLARSVMSGSGACVQENQEQRPGQQHDHPEVRLSRQAQRPRRQGLLF